MAENAACERFSETVEAGEDADTEADSPVFAIRTLNTVLDSVTDMMLQVRPSE